MESTEKGSVGLGAYDDTPPRNRLILFYTVLVVLTLILLEFAFRGLLDRSRLRASVENINGGPSVQRLEAHRAEVRRALSQGERPIEKAMTELAERGRLSFPQIYPFPSEDRGPKEGWMHRPSPPSPPIPSFEVDL
ncbi:MAG: hypothetical protein NZM37_11240 [Sandaracinaceae bacterium]|nr:hypothetical protein [Sandaracinaceae bacterium]MDW8247178.1 hypothetical protein [Sandaracinaceae bacterium]